MSTKDERIAELEAERDALAAQVRAAQVIAEVWQGNDCNIGEALSRLELWANRADHDPNGELARRDARMKADALARDLETEGHHRRAVEESEQALAAHVEGLKGALRRCRHHACYSIGEPEALAAQMSKVRRIADQCLDE